MSTVALPRGHCDAHTPSTRNGVKWVERRQLLSLFSYSHQSRGVIVGLLHTSPSALLWQRLSHPWRERHGRSEKGDVEWWLAQFSSDHFFDRNGRGNCTDQLVSFVPVSGLALSATVARFLTATTHFGRGLVTHTTSKRSRRRRRRRKAVEYRHNNVSLYPLLPLFSWDFFQDRICLY